MLNNTKAVTPAALRQGFGQTSVLNVGPLHRPTPTLVTDMKEPAKESPVDLPMRRSKKLLKTRLKLRTLPHRPRPATPSLQTALSLATTSLPVPHAVGQTPLLAIAVIKMTAYPEPDKAGWRVKPREIPPTFAL